MSQFKIYKQKPPINCIYTLGWRKLRNIYYLLGKLVFEHQKYLNEKPRLISRIIE